MHRKIVPDVVSDQDIRLFTAETSVLEAARYMSERHIGAVLIGTDGRLSGIFTERDLLTRVVAAGRDPAATRLEQVMTRDPDTLEPGDAAFDALEKMNARGYRHLPVVDGGRLVGIVSIRDLHAAVKRELEADLERREAFIFGSGYSAG